MDINTLSTHYFQMSAVQAVHCFKINSHTCTNIQKLRSLLSVRTSSVHTPVDIILSSESLCLIFINFLPIVLSFHRPQFLTNSEIKEKTLFLWTIPAFIAPLKATCHRTDNVSSKEVRLFLKLYANHWHSKAPKHYLFFPTRAKNLSNITTF